MNAGSQRMLAVLGAVSMQESGGQPRDQHGRYTVDAETVDPHHRRFTPTPVPFDAGARTAVPRQHDPVREHGAALAELLQRRRLEPPGVWCAGGGRAAGP